MIYMQIILMSTIIFLSSQVVAKDDKKSGEGVDYVALAALLVKGGDFEKADNALNKISQQKIIEAIDDYETNESSKTTKQKKQFSLSRFYTINGLIKLRLQRYKDARDSYLLAQKYGQKYEDVFIYLAQSYYGLDDFDSVLLTLSKAEDVWRDIPRVWLLKALSYHAKRNFNLAMKTLLDAEMKFPFEKQFVQRRVFLLIELGLYQEAVQIGLASLNVHESEIVDYQTIGKAMIETGQYDHALPILEKAALIYPHDVTLLRTLSRVYFLKDNFYAAATILEKSAAYDVSLNSEVAELYRKSNRSEQALYFNQIVLDQNKKFKQRLAIYLDAGRFDDAIGMKNTLYRVGLLNDGNIRYAIAYAYFSVGKYEQAEEYLDGIQQSSLFRKATQLRKAMLVCEKSPVQC